MSDTEAAKALFNNIMGDSNMNSWDGKEVEIIGLIANPQDTSECDVIAMPQFKIKQAETGEISAAYVDEIDEQFWTQEMKAVLEGQEAWLVGKKMAETPYKGELAKHFNNGQIIIQHKYE